MESDAPVVGPDVPTANSLMVKLDIATADWPTKEFKGRVAVVTGAASRIGRAQ
jgi:hypothetical protein